MWSVADGRTHLRGATLPAQGAVLSRGSSLVRAGGDRADAAGGLSLHFPAWIRRQQPARPDSLTARVGPLRRCRRQGAHGAIWQVCNLGAPRGRRSPVLDPPGAVADFRTRVFYRGPSAPRSVRRRPSATGRSYRATHGTCRRQPASPRPGRPRPPVPCPWGGCRCRCRAPEC